MLKDRMAIFGEKKTEAILSFLNNYVVLKKPTSCVLSVSDFFSDFYHSPNHSLQVCLFLEFFGGMAKCKSPQMLNLRAFDGFCSWLVRRGGDSNPRKCYLQQFSRLPQSTALPPLRNCDAGTEPRSPAGRPGSKSKTFGSKND
jgi:hypothetical protein